MLTGPEKFVSRIVFFSAKSKVADKSHITLKSLTASTICCKEGPYPGHIRLWCGSDVTFFTWLYKKMLTVLHFSIIEVFWLRNLCGVGGDSSFSIILFRTVFEKNYLFHAESARNIERFNLYMLHNRESSTT